jgi:succinate dehydrogenase/fumarate reductase flavoprotein subunit
VISKHTDEPIAGLFCCGEMVGGLFSGNYPGKFFFHLMAGVNKIYSRYTCTLGGSGLTAGTVWGRKAGEHVAKLQVLEGKGGLSS